MRRYFDVWVEDEHDSEGRRTAHQAVWIQCVRIKDARPDYVLRGPAVRCVQSGLDSGSDFLTLWVGYAVRTARAWNALNVAADLSGLEVLTPPYVLADAVRDRGEERLADLLWDCFGNGVIYSQGDGLSPVPWPRPHPSETGEDGYIIV